VTTKLVWHVTCNHLLAIAIMAAKIRLMKLLQEIRGFAQITNRRPAPRQPGLFLMQLRSQFTQGSPLRRKLVIPVDLQDLPDIPHPVKITYVKAPSETEYFVPSS